MVKCTDCKHCQINGIIAQAKAEYCIAGIWDREDPEQKWLQADDDFAEYISKARFCSEYESL